MGVQALNDLSSRFRRGRPWGLGALGLGAVALAALFFLRRPPGAGWSDENAAWGAAELQGSEETPPTPAELERRRAVTERGERSSLERAAEECRARIEQARGSASLPGAPRLEKQRAQLLARAKSDPVVFVDVPQFDAYVTRGIAIHQNRIATTPYPRDTVLELLKQYRGMHRELRQLFIRGGYFYIDDPAAARELSVLLSLEKLFVEPELVLERGSERFQLQKKKGGYFYADGRDAGSPAALLLFDRVWVKGENPGPSLHLDVRELVQRESADAIRVDHMTEREVVAELRFEDEWVPALLARNEADLELSCLLVEPSLAGQVGRARDSAFRRAQVVRAMREAIVRQVQAGLPFDEPKTEVGQQDGELRRRWEQAYFAGQSSFTFNRDKYQVFDANGKPLTPQVCVDFITETLERASGMSFAPRDKPAEKILGALDFDEILQADRRRESALRQYARLHPHRLELLDFPESSWVRYETVPKFFRFIEQNKDEMRPGDIVIIRGRAAWDFYRELHTHTFFIYESDPVTGMPLLLAGNSGKPRILTWDDEMLRAPRRSVQHRIRPNMDWLYDHVVLKEPLRGERWAAPLTVYRD